MASACSLGEAPLRSATVRPSKRRPKGLVAADPSLSMSNLLMALSRTGLLCRTMDCVWTTYSDVSRSREVGFTLLVLRKSSFILCISTNARLDIQEPAPAKKERGQAAEEHKTEEHPGRGLGCVCNRRGLDGPPPSGTGCRCVDITHSWIVARLSRGYVPHGPTDCTVGLVARWLSTDIFLFRFGSGKSSEATTIRQTLRYGISKIATRYLLVRSLEGANPGFFFDALVGTNRISSGFIEISFSLPSRFFSGSPRFRFSTCLAHAA